MFDAKVIFMFTFNISCADVQLPWRHCTNSCYNEYPFAVYSVLEPLVSCITWAHICLCFWFGGGGGVVINFSRVTGVFCLVFLSNQQWATPLRLWQWLSCLPLGLSFMAITPATHSGDLGRKPCSGDRLPCRCSRVPWYVLSLDNYRYLSHYFQSNILRRWN
jgi:hypothetical protein